MTVPARASSAGLRAVAIPPRLRPALAVSLVFHWLLALSLAPETLQGQAWVMGSQPISARIERLPARVPGDGAVPDNVEGPARPRQVEQQAAAVKPDTSRARLEMATPAAAASLPVIPDPTIYPARDLDSYPRPVVPLDTKRIEHGMQGGPLVVRLEVTIDERGIVNEAVVVAPGQADPVESELRALLAATRFIPARKEGRAVKSRVLLDIGLVAAKNDSR